MTAVYILIFFTAWFACGVVAAGYRFAYFQRKYPGFAKRDFKAEKALATDSLLNGPIDLLIVYQNGRTEYGWLWPWSAKARREAGIDGRIKP
jgi:hypothetical protein